jgi:hypothetical protein
MGKLHCRRHTLRCLILPAGGIVLCFMLCVAHLRGASKKVLHSRVFNAAPSDATLTSRSFAHQHCDVITLLWRHSRALRVSQLCAYGAMSPCALRQLQEIKLGRQLSVSVDAIECSSRRAVPRAGREPRGTQGGAVRISRIGGDCASVIGCQPRGPSAW